jgi:hypothetical protein
MSSEQSVVELAEVAADNAQRVVVNGGEPDYCAEKLTRALSVTARALSHIRFADASDVPLDELLAIVERAYNTEKGRAA